MSTASPIAIKTQVRHLFATPLVISDLDAQLVARINPKLVQTLLNKEKETPSQNASNNGGWQSDDKIIEWGGDDVTIILKAIYQVLNQITVHYNPTGVHRGGIEWKTNGWANINRKGNSNAAHIHPGAYWSAVYYVLTENNALEKGGGDFQAMDPRGGLPLMYCPLLRMGLEGYMTAGHKETFRPSSGQFIIFPSWLSHSVTPYQGDGARISLAFNFSV